MSETERSYSGTVIAAILIAVMVAGVGYRYWPSDERSIRRHLSNLAEALSFPLVESNEERLTRVEVLREYFAPDVHVQVDGRDLTSRDDVIHTVTQYQPPPGGLQVEFVNLLITIADDHQSATVTFTAKASWSEANGVSKLEERAADITMRQADGDWLISTANLRPTTVQRHMAFPESSALSASWLAVCGWPAGGPVKLCKSAQPAPRNET
jgi:hypothetical protein